MLSVITTHVRKSPPELETVLEKIKWLRGNYMMINDMYYRMVEGYSTERNQCYYI